MSKLDPEIEAFQRRCTWMELQAPEESMACNHIWKHSQGEAKCLRIPDHTGMHWDFKGRHWNREDVE